MRRSSVMMVKRRPRDLASFLRRLLSSISSLAKSSWLKPPSSRNRSARAKTYEPAAHFLRRLTIFQKPTKSFRLMICSSRRTRQPPPAYFPDAMRLAVAAKSVALGKESASTKIIQRSEEHTSELQSRLHLVCRLLLEKKK